jgi:hypothetical protein
MAQAATGASDVGSTRDSVLGRADHGEGVSSRWLTAEGADPEDQVAGRLLVAVGLEVGHTDPGWEVIGGPGLGVAGEPQPDIRKTGQLFQGRGHRRHPPGPGVGVEDRPGAAAGDGAPTAGVPGFEEVAADVDAEGIDAPPVDLGGDPGDEIIGLGDGQVLVVS